MRFSCWSSDVCSSDLQPYRLCFVDVRLVGVRQLLERRPGAVEQLFPAQLSAPFRQPGAVDARRLVIVKAIVNAARLKPVARLLDRVAVLDPVHGDRHSAVLTYAPMPLERRAHSAQRSEEHTSELQSLMRISY